MIEGVAAPSEELALEPDDLLLESEDLLVTRLEQRHQGGVPLLELSGDFLHVPKIGDGMIRRKQKSFSRKN